LPESDKEAGSQRGVNALRALEHYFARVQAIWKPVATEEAFEIVRRRLFSQYQRSASSHQRLPNLMLIFTHQMAMISRRKRRTVVISNGCVRLTLFIPKCSTAFMKTGQRWTISKERVAF
jgi:predicted AAA+ superfamily ATPase